MSSRTRHVLSFGYVARSLALILVGLLPVLAAHSAPQLSLLGASGSEVAVKVSELSAHSMFALVRGVDFSADGHLLAVDAEGPTIEVWDWHRKAIVRSLLKPHGGNDFRTVDPLRFSPDGRILVNCEQSGADNVSARIWKASDGSIVKDIAGGSDPAKLGICVALDFSPDGHQLFIASDSLGGGEGNIYAYEGDDFHQVWSMKIDRFVSPNYIAASPDGKLLAVAGSLAAPKNGKFGQEFNIYLVSSLTHEVVKVFSSLVMGSLEWSPDGKRLAAAGDQLLSMFSTETGEKIAEENLSNSAHLKIRFTGDGRYLILADSNGQGTGMGVRIWDSALTHLLQEIPGNTESLAVSQDSHYMALGTSGKTTIWALK